MARANPGIHSIQVGDVTVTALNDGQFEASTALLIGSNPEQSEALLRDSFRPLPPRITVSCFLVETPERRVLIDAGTGGAYGAVLGHAGEKLAALGVSPDSIDTILLTHGHGDHLGGLVDAQGKPTYGRAELVVNGVEADFWTSDENMAAATPDRRGGFEIARRSLAAYAARTRRIGDGQEALPGITARLFPGHTPGHTGFAITSGTDSLLIWGDIVHLPAVQFARPEVGVGFDSDVAQGRATRAKILDEAATDRLLVGGIHHDFPIFGHILRRGSGYAFEPVVWAPTAAGMYE